MAGYTGIIDATPGFVPGTFDAKDVRLGMFFNALPGLFASGDFAVSQRGAGANQSVDIAQGRALLLPAYTHGGAYMARRTSGTAYNTSADGGYTWAASDGVNPRIDILGIEASDVDEGGSYTGWKFRVIDGTPNAGATHQLDAQLWPALPTDGSFVPIAAIRRAAGSTTIATADITNLNPIGGGRSVARSVTSAETATASSPGQRLATPDFAMVYVPSSAARIRFGYKGQWRHSAGGVTCGVTLFVDDVQATMGDYAGAAGTYVYEGAVSTFYGHFHTSPLKTSGPGGAGFFGTLGGSGSDVVDGNTLGVNGVTDGGFGELSLFGLAAGWHVIEPRFYENGAGTLTVRNRLLWAEVVA